MTDFQIFILIIAAVLMGIVFGFAIANAYWKRIVENMKQRHISTISKISSDCAILFAKYFSLARLLHKPLDLSRERNDDECS